MRVVVIYNSSSGGRYTLPRLRRICKENNITITYSFTPKQLASRKLRQLIQEGNIVMVVGGDGTLNSAARLLVNTPSVLLPLPGGTLNNFVRDLSMNGSVEDLMARVHTARELVVDVGYVNDELFLNNSSLGLYPFTLLDRKKSSPLLTKWGAATLAAIKQLAVFDRHRLLIDGKKIRSPFVFVGNNTYDIAASLLPQRRKLTQGVLTVMVATSRSRWHLIRAGFDVVRGKVSHRDDFSLTKRTSLTIYTHATELPVSYDGEVKQLASPFYYRVERKALRVLVIK